MENSIHVPAEYYASIRKIDFNVLPKTILKYDLWKKRFNDFKDNMLSEKLEVIMAHLKIEVTRTDLVNFYQIPDIDAETKFIATMIWGHEASEGGRRDFRGPWKVTEMFNESVAATKAIREVSVSSNKDIMTSYRTLNKKLKMCGPNFFTKHLYFLGKSSGINLYPLIFDNRVASGIVKLSLNSSKNLDFVNVSTKTTPEAYLTYLKLVCKEAEVIECELDKIEYFLFNF